jgi:hypothetical protein
LVVTRNKRWRRTLRLEEHDVLLSFAGYMN